MDSARTAALQASYDRVAAEYATRFFDELAHKPLDRALLDYFADQVRGQGPVADLGCGPGQIARYLAARGLPARGLDVSAAMVALARQLSPAIPFAQGTMLALDAADGAWAGITAFYSIIHLPPADLPRAFAEFARVLRPGGLLLISVHLGQECVHLDEWWGEAVDLDFQFYELPRLTALLEAAGFTVEASIARAPYRPLEHPSQRGYLFARRPPPAAPPG